MHRYRVRSGFPSALLRRSRGLGRATVGRCGAWQILNQAETTGDWSSMAYQHGACDMFLLPFRLAFNRLNPA